ncbi:thioredoxin domain-containing protein 11 isoform X3 [Channa argus]|uniref:thioredoxin domain-containing protein 11 isoform X3 n=1 Tax=Channa argus TaxID=215402 RepID=UPI003522792C
MLRRVRQSSLRQVLYLMARRPDLLCGAIVLGVLLILAVKFTCSRANNVVAAAQPPVRFFSAEAPVVDLYLGQLDQVERLRSVAEVSLIFFYAPWCAHSMAARQEVQEVARKLAKQVQFVAINCWWSQGKCRRQNRFYQYPIIHLFYRRFGPIDYKGPFVAPYVESFILRVITPLTYLPSRARLQEFLSYHEPRVVGFFQFNTSPQPPGYITYLSSALQALRRDFRGVVRFGVVTSKQVAEAISLKEDETVYLHRRFNSSLIFPRWKHNFTSEAICSWVFEHHETVLRWLQPPGTKSRLLEHELSKGPALLLFLPHNPLSSQPNPILQQQEGDGIAGLRCRTNRTLRFYVLDVALNWPLAVRLGASGNRSSFLHREDGVQSDGTEDGLFAAIVNLKDEVHYVLHRSPAATLTDSLEAFIRNFSAPYSVLQRHLVGEQNRKGAREEVRRQDEHQQSPQHPLITELTTSTFLPYVMDPEKDVLLVYYTQWCGFCSILHHIIIQLARLLQGNRTITVARVNVARNDLPWEFMVDHVPSFLFFPRYRKHYSVKFPDELPITLPNLLRFILRNSGSVQHAEKPVACSVEADGSGPSAVFRAEFLALQRELQTLHHARDRLSQQLAQLWRNNRRLTFDTRSLEAQNAELQRERQSLEEQHREKSRQLEEAVKRLQELADTSETLLNENTLLRVLLRTLKDRTEAGEQTEVERRAGEHKRSHMAS